MTSLLPVSDDHNFTTMYTCESTKAKGVQHVLDKLSPCASGLYEMIPPDIVEELEAPRQQDEGENARGTLEYCRVVAER